MNMFLMMTLLSQLISTCSWWILTLSNIFTTSLRWERGSLSIQTQLTSGEQRTSSIFVNLSVQHWQRWNIQPELDCHERRSVENYNWLQSFQCRHWKPCTTLQVATHNNINIFLYASSTGALVLLMIIQCGTLINSSQRSVCSSTRSAVFLVTVVSGGCHISSMILTSPTTSAGTGEDTRTATKTSTLSTKDVNGEHKQQKILGFYL